MREDMDANFCSGAYVSQLEAPRPMWFKTLLLDCSMKRAHVAELHNHQDHSGARLLDNESSSMLPG